MQCSSAWKMASVLSVTAVWTMEVVALSVRTQSHSIQKKNLEKNGI